MSAVVVCIDQAVKTLMLAALPQPGSGWAVTGFFNLVHVRNHGVGFGMMSGIAPWALIVFSLSVVCILVVWMGRAHDRFTAAALGLTVGGAVGNVADRAVSGAVSISRFSRFRLSLAGIQRGGLGDRPRRRRLAGRFGARVASTDGGQG